MIFSSVVPDIMNKAAEKAKETEQETTDTANRVQGLVEFLNAKQKADGTDHEYRILETLMNPESFTVNKFTCFSLCIESHNLFIILESNFLHNALEYFPWVIKDSIYDRNSLSNFCSFTFKIMK